MSRRKKSPSSRRSGIAPAASERNHVDPADQAAPEASPPRPNKAFLVAACLLLAAWIAFLIVLAVRA
ncbi:MAG: hypothetical protein ABIK89_06610 [Planctomycetota bacterium]